eukprot:scaffold36833_cov100-Phaeocystis_antarctica.AAC.6
MSELGWQAHRAQPVRIQCAPCAQSCTVRAHSGLTARHVIHRRAAGQLADEMSSPGDYLPVRVGPAFGIAPCGELWAKELGGGAWRQNMCVSECLQNGLLHPYTAQKSRCAA